MTIVKFQLETLSCPSCIKKIETVLNKRKGVKKANVLFHYSKVKTEYDDTMVTAAQLEETIIKLGYPILSKK